MIRGRRDWKSRQAAGLGAGAKNGSSRPCPYTRSRPNEAQRSRLPPKMSMRSSISTYLYMRWLSIVQNFYDCLVSTEALCRTL
jgi:hypothetical protein